jgi:PPOX class probable F420-dependent enzyme
MPHKMSSEEIRTFLQEAPRTGHLATVREDGRPHVATIWFMVDGDDVVFATSSASVKGKNLTRTGFAALSVDDSVPPFSYVALEGPVVMVDDMEPVRHWATIIAARYMGSDWAEEFGRLDSFPDDLVCRLTPSHMTGHASMAA